MCQDLAPENSWAVQGTFHHHFYAFPGDPGGHLMASASTCACQMKFMQGEYRVEPRLTKYSVTYIFQHSF